MGGFKLCFSLSPTLRRDECVGDDIPRALRSPEPGTWESKGRGKKPHQVGVIKESNPVFEQMA
jgi:hypothetical protein